MQHFMWQADDGEALRSLKLVLLLLDVVAVGYVAGNHGFPQPQGLQQPARLHWLTVESISCSLCGHRIGHYMVGMWLSHPSWSP